MASLPSFSDLLPDVDEKLWTANMLLFCVALLKWKIIPKYVYDLILLLHNVWVDPKVLGRFLVFSVHRQIQRGKSQDDLKSAIKEYSKKQMMKRESSKLAKSKVSSQVYLDVDTPEQFLNINLTHEHITVLLDGLVDVHAANKWEEIGIALGLPLPGIEECRKGDCLAESRLRNVLSLWVDKKYPDCLPSTLNSLRKALCSPLVQLNAVAESIYMIFKDMLKPELLEQLAASGDILVVDGRPTLLECRQDHKRKIVSYQWLKDGIPLSDNGLYLGTNTQILVIVKAHHGTGGLYSCKVLECNWEWYSSSFWVSVVVSPIKQRLLAFYSKNGCDIPMGVKPLMKTLSKYTDLTLLNAKCEFSKCCSEDGTNAMSERFVDYKKLFTEYKARTVFILEGEAGSGKSCLCFKVAYDWATKGSKLNNAKFVFLLSLEDFPTECNLSVLLSHIYKNTLELEQVLNVIEITKGDGFCFILDGLDKYHPNNGDKSKVYELIRKRYLPNAMVIVTARPIADAGKQFQIKAVIKVVGFSQENIFEFVRNYAFDSHTFGTRSSSVVCSYLHKHPSVLQLCSLPLYLGTICHQYMHKYCLPFTEAILISTVICEHLSLSYYHDVMPHLRLNDLPSDIKQDFMDMCCLAFSNSFPSAKDCTLRKFTKQNVMISKVGLVTVVPSSTASNNVEYSFIDVYIQEYLAALYINSLPLSRQMALILEYPQKSKVWKFYFGIHEFGNSSLELINLFQKCHKFKPKYLFQCAYESQQAVVCEAVSKMCPPEINLKDKLATSAIVEIVFYVLSFLADPAITLNCRSIHHSYDVTKALADGLKFNESIHTLNFSFCSDVISNGSKELGKAFKRNHTLQSLSISNCELNKENLELLAYGLNQNSIIRYFDISRNDIRAKDLTIVKKFVQRLHTFIFAHNYFDKEGADILSSIISCSQIRNLDLSGIGISSRDMLILTKAFTKCQNLRVLNLSNNNIDHYFAKELQKMLQYNSVIEVLDLSGNSIGMSGAQALGMALTDNTKLHTIVLAQNNIGPEGMKYLAEGLEFNKTLKTLDLSLNALGTNGAISLALAISNNTSLTSLNVRENKIRCLGMDVLVQNLIHSGTIEDIDLSWNELDRESAMYLADWICQSKNTMSLNISHTIAFDSLPLFALHLRQCTSVKKLDISFNSNVFYLEEIENVANVITHLPTIQELDISGNNISDTNIASLVMRLRRDDCHIIALKLNHNYIKSYQARLLTNGLRHNYSLQCLDLSWNSLGCEGAKAIARGLKVNKTLQNLNLGHNNIATTGAMAIANGIEFNSTIRYIDLSWNNISSDGIVDLLRATKENVSIQFLNLENNCIGSKGLKEVEEILELTFNFSAVSIKMNSRHEEYLIHSGSECPSNNTNSLQVEIKNSFQENVMTNYSTNDGFEVVEEVCYSYEGKSSEFNWNGLGFKLLFHNEAPAQLFFVSAAINGDFELPPHAELVSGVFRIETSLECKVPTTTIWIQHCVSAKVRKNLCFVVSNNTKPPYKFNYYDGGNFSSESEYGEIIVESFSIWAVIYKYGVDGIFSLFEKNYLATLHQHRFPEQSENQTLYGYYVSFIKNCFIFQKSLRKYCSESEIVKCTDVTFQFQDQVNELEVLIFAEEPEDLLIQFTNNTTVRKSEIDNYVEGRPPILQFHVEIGRRIASYHYKMVLQGTENDIFIRRRHIIQQNGHGELRQIDQAHAEMVQNIDARELDINDLGDIHRELRNRIPSRWQRFAVQLGLPYYSIQNIRQDYPNRSEECLQVALASWLQLNYNYQRRGMPSWRRIAEAVMVFDGDFFQQIVANHSIERPN